MGKRRGRKGKLTGRNTLDTTTTRETTDGGLGDALDVVTEDLAVTLGAAFAEAFATFSAWMGLLVCVGFGLGRGGGEVEGVSVEGWW